MTNIEEATKFKNLGNTSFQSGEFQEAADHFTKAIELNPTDHVYYSNRSGAYASLKNYESALQDAQKCIELKPDWAKGYSRKGLAEFHLGDTQKSVDTYKKGLTFDANNQQLKEGLAQAENSLKSDFDMSNVFSNPQALQLMMKLMNDPETKDMMSDPTLMSTIQIAMTNPSILPALAQKDPRIQKILNVISKPPSADQMNFEDILKNAKKGQSSQSKDQSFSSKNQEKPKPPQKEVSPAEQFKTQGNAEYTKRNFEKALELYSKAIESDPNEPLYFNNKAACYIELNQLEEAEKEVEKGLELFSNGTVKDFVKKAKILARRASILAKQQKYDEAMLAYDKSLIEDYKQNVKDELTKVKNLKKVAETKAYINPEVAEQHCQKGNELFKSGSYPDSVKEYQEAIKRNPQMAKYHANLAASYIKLMDFVDARDSLDKALKLDPNYVKAYTRKGDCHYALKEYHKALEMYEKGLILQPENKLCSDGIQKTRQAIFSSSNEEDAQERAKHAMADPEIQRILQSPQIRTVLNDIQADPSAATKAFQNPDIAAKLTKLIEAGVIRTG